MRITGQVRALVAEAQVFEGGDGVHVDCDFVHGRAEVVRGAEFDAEGAGSG